MAIVTLTTDWGHRDHHLAAFKGSLLSLLPAITIVDITHDVNPHDTLQASFILKNAYRQFPEGTVHFSGLMGVPAGSQPELLIVQSEGHSFVGMDNGLFSLVLGERPRRILSVPTPSDHPGGWRNAATACICSLLSGTGVVEGVEERTKMMTTFSPQPMTDADSMRATVVYVDEFENLVLNITREQFDSHCKQRKFSIEMRRVNQPIQRISQWYNEVDEGELLALFNSDGLLEIALNKANASGLLGIKLYDSIRINFS